MSDASSDNPPPKLKLQRPTASNQSDAPKPKLQPPAASNESNAPKPKPKLKPAAASNQSDAPKPQLKAPKLAQTPSDTPSASPKLAPANPEAIKESEISTPPVASPPPLKTKAPAAKPEPAPAVQNRLDERPPKGTQELLQQSLKASHKPTNIPEPTNPRSSIGTSLALIIVLLLIFGGGGYTVWEMFLKSDSTTEEAPQADASASSKPKNPIERAKATIAKVPTTDIDAITGETSEAVPAAKTPAPEATVTDNIAAVESTAPAPTPAPAPAVNTSDLRSTVSNFLSTAQINGVRTGAKARVMMNNGNYNIGDVVDPATGLTFVGTQDGKLVFKDRNEVTYHKSF